MVIAVAMVVWANCIKVSLCFQNCLKVREVHKPKLVMRGILGFLNSHWRVTANGSSSFSV